MSYSSKVLWGEGLFLRPQHFQRQDAYHESRLREMIYATHPYAWGVRSLKVDGEALSSGVLRITDVSIVFPDGEIYSAPGSDPLPAAVSLEEVAGHSGDLTFFLALAPMKDFGQNYASEDSPRADSKFVQNNAIANDWFTEAASAEIAFLKKNVRVLSASEPREQFVTIPIVRLKKTGSGGFETDASFIPPCLTIAGSSTLFGQLRSTLDMLQAKVAALQGFHREPSKNVIEFRSGDVASFWLLHTASEAFASLSHLFAHPALHPERMFQRLLELAGALMTFAKTYALSDLPTYQHSAPEQGFRQLDLIVRELLETVISTRYFAISLSEVRPSYHSGRLDSEKIDEQTRFYFAVSADMPSHELVDAVPIRFKIGSPDDVEKLVLSAMPGVRLTHAAQVPPAIPVRPGAYYFAVDPRGTLYERMLQSQSVMIYVPTGINDLKLELIAVTQ